LSKDQTMNILDKLSDIKVLVIGDVMLDRYWWGDVSRISPEAPVPIVRLQKMSAAAGGAANVAANIAGLGATPVLIGVCGDDGEAAVLANVLSDAGVASDGLIRCRERGTICKTRIVAHSQHVVRIDSEVADALPDEHAENIIERIAAEAPGADVIVLSDYAKGVLCGAVLSAVIEIAANSGKRVIVDPKGRDFNKYKGVSVITPNRREAAEAVGIDAASETAVTDAGRSLMSGLGLDAMLVTEGERGMTLFQAPDSEVRFDALAHQVFDVTGAGDTVIASFAAAVAAGGGFEEAARLANAAASIVVGSIGTTTITRDALDTFLSSSEAARQINA
jgi:D-beta-D-heptose 7-phosphate kinase/D-beta-D-heptose 1-phosphate adenosyltransferase